MVQIVHPGARVRRALGTWLFAFVSLLLAGCGGGAMKDAAFAPPTPAAVAAEEAPAKEPDAGEATLYSAASVDDGEYRERSKVAQAAPPTGAGGSRDAPKKSAEPTTPDAVGSGTESKPSVDTGAQKVAGPMLIYRATLHMAVFETRKAIDAVEQLAKESGGYLVSREDQSITIRVPAGQFDGALGKIAKLGDLLHRNVNVQDVTAEYTDLAIRLRNLEVMRERLEELLKKAQKVEEALAVERELERVAGEIERLKGRLKLLRELVSYSTITVEFQPRPVDHVDSKVRLPFPWLDRLGLGDLLRL